MCSCVSLKMAERLYTVCTFSNYCVCIVVCRVNGCALSVWNCKGRINVSRPSGKNLVLHSAAKDINSREAEWWSPTCGPNPDSLNPVPSHVSGHSKKPCWYLTDWNSISIIMLSRIIPVLAISCHIALNHIVVLCLKLLVDALSKCFLLQCLINIARGQCGKNSSAAWFNMPSKAVFVM